MLTIIFPPAGIDKRFWGVPQINIIARLPPYGYGERMDLTEYRRIHGIKGADLAKRLGVAPSSVSRLENRQGSPSRELIMAIRRETANLVQPNDLFPSEPESPNHGQDPTRDA